MAMISPHARAHAYDNSESGLNARTVQEAVDRLVQDGILPGRTAFVSTEYTGLGAPKFTSEQTALTYLNALTPVPSTSNPVLIISYLKPADQAILDRAALEASGIFIRRINDAYGGGVDLTPYLKKDGSVAMTGLLTLSGAPTQDLHAATRKFVLDNAGGGGVSGTSYLYVRGNGTATQNAAELQSVYNLAKTMTPYGSALSAINRIVILIGGGRYRFTDVFTVDTQFIDLVSLSGQADVMLSAVNGSNGINVTANDVTLTGINVSSQTFLIADNLSLLKCNNCTGGDHSFGGNGGVASGTFTNCTGGDFSFGGGGTASGIFTDCTGGDYSFGNTASGTFTNCTGGDFLFGSGNTASGTFTNCTGGDGSFGGDGGELTGKLLYCQLTAGTFPTPSSGGRVRLSLDGGFNIVNTG